MKTTESCNVTRRGRRKKNSNHLRGFFDPLIMTPNRQTVMNLRLSLSIWISLPVDSSVNVRHPQQVHIVNQFLIRLNFSFFLSFFSHSQSLIYLLNNFIHYYFTLLLSLFGNNLFFFFFANTGNVVAAIRTGSSWWFFIYFFLSFERKINEGEREGKLCQLKMKLLCVILQYNGMLAYYTIS
jgi:hypothetical protein